MVYKNLKPMRFAHRGVVQCAPENTLGAFEAAAEMGCEGIEIDINMSEDGEIFVVHDDNQKYMSGGKTDACIHELTSAEIKSIDIPFRDRLLPPEPPVPWTERGGNITIINSPDDGENRVTHLLTFAEFDRWLSARPEDITVEVEFKMPGMLPRMTEILNESGNYGKYIFFSGDMPVLDDMQSFFRTNKKPETLRLGANIRYINEKTMEFVKASDLYEVGLNSQAFIKEDVDMLAQMGIKVFSNLGDYPEWWARLAIMGVTGFKTNYPESYTAWLKGRQN